MKDNLKWIIIFLLLCILSTFFYCIHIHIAKGECIAQIKQNGRIIKKINLSDVKSPYDLKIKSHDGGYNTVRVMHNQIAVIDADCPDKLCVKRGAIDGGSIPIVCLPHKLSVTIIGEDKIDAVSRGVIND